MYLDRLFPFWRFSMGADTNSEGSHYVSPAFTHIASGARSWIFSAAGDATDHTCRGKPANEGTGNKLEYCAF